MQPQQVHSSIAVADLRLLPGNATIFTPGCLRGVARGQHTARATAPRAVEAPLRVQGPLPSGWPARPQCQDVPTERGWGRGSQGSHDRLPTR